MAVYEFRDRAEFVAYLETKAKEARQLATKLHPRTHGRAIKDAEAAAHESIAAIVRSSNLVTK